MISNITRRSMMLSVVQRPATMQRCALSTHTSQAMAKLQAVLEDYRLQHYTQEIPTRFKKEIVSAASQPQYNSNNSGSDGVVNVTGLQHVLQNIGAPNALTVHEMLSIFQEVGNERGEIPTQTMMQIL